MKRIYLFIIITLTFVLVISGCSKQTNQTVKLPTISMNSDSEYVNTFKGLSLGVYLKTSGITNFNGTTYHSKTTSGLATNKEVDDNFNYLIAQQRYYAIEHAFPN